MSIAVARAITVISIIFYFIIFPSVNLLFVIGGGVISIFLLTPSRKRILSDLNIKEKEIKN